MYKVLKHIINTILLELPWNVIMEWDVCYGMIPTLGAPFFYKAWLIWSFLKPYSSRSQMYYVHFVHSTFDLSFKKLSARHELLIYQTWGHQYFPMDNRWLFDCVIRVFYELEPKGIDLLKKQKDYCRIKQWSLQTINHVLAIFIYFFLAEDWVFHVNPFVLIATAGEIWY